jgi:3-oxoadipate CoA-transferase alpha subunit
MINKCFDNIKEAIKDIKSGDSILIGGFGECGVPLELIDAIADSNIKELTIISNNAGIADRGIAKLLQAKMVKKIIGSYPRSLDSYVVDDLYKKELIELEVIPQGTFVERIRAAGAGLGGFYTLVGVGTMMAEGKEIKIIEGKEYIFEKPLRGNVALIKAYKADRWGNLVYKKTARNFNPVMATAADLVIAEVDEIVELGELDPEEIVTPGIFVDRIYQCKKVYDDLLQNVYVKKHQMKNK